MTNDPFRAIGHPIRRIVIERLAHGPATVAEVSRGCEVSKPTITQHLRILEQEQIVTRHVVGREHILHLNRHAMSPAVEWIEHQRNLWERMFDAVEAHLDERVANPSLGRTGKELP